MGREHPKSSQRLSAAVAERNELVQAPTTLSADSLQNPLPRRSAECCLWLVHSPDRAQVGGSWPLAEDILIVGRDVEGGGASVADRRMSRTHFRIAYDGRSLCHWLGDAGSRNGVYRNGERTSGVRLQPGDVVRAGDSLFVYSDSDRMSKLELELPAVASSQLSTLILGPTGSGKERIARALHAKSERAGDFVPINCAAIPRELVAAELFGHTRGAFSGAQSPRTGLIVAAQGGTLFLDEIGDLPFDLQGVLLRVLQDGVVRPVGSDRTIEVDLRVIAATHVNLEAAVQQERFRGDLYARLARVVLSIPQLKDRRHRILELARELCPNPVEFELAAAESLLCYDWPFNVRQLESMMCAFAALTKSQEFTSAYLNEHHPELLQQAPEPESIEHERTKNDDGAHQPSRAELEELLRKHRGNVSAVAEQLGKRRTQLYRWLRAVGLSPERYR